MWKWQQGRQGGGYKKFSIVMTKFPIPWDMHLLYIPSGAEIKLHIDSVEGYKMYRINIILKQAKEGGKFFCPGAILNWRRIKLFRPDIMSHGVTKVSKGERLVLSVGWCIK